MKLIIDQLKECIRSHPDVLNSSIGNTPSWKRTQCIVLAQIISDALLKSEVLKGSKTNHKAASISSMTLQRIFSDSYTEKVNPDLRFLKTLDKLAIFLGYTSLNNFLSHQSEKEKETEVLESKKQTEAFEKLIFGYCQESFKCLQNLPAINCGELSNYVFDDGPLKKRIKKALTKYSNYNILISNIENKATFTISDFNMVTVEEDLVVLSVTESWHFEWKSANDNEVNRYNKENRQSYFLKERDGKWKIWDNHNPDYNELILEVKKAYSTQDLSV
ncbi:hypothetical protein FSS13T_05690 [Flavobacterium saliperosum S13]|uniref:Uncharacterized protein n=2 Tax=Flavobacterium saliperosum TaxID=329186 RepID=A0A1G4V8S3_9FLAO|nr:hypothetical protein [Flavobacterium saliperosum]ESU28078.1 hypothetical protein FSS13T_05690 [Flavobacterium saliperosum S13]SCX02986.1 hypothetical protein SAMN02927925_00597 [Flavobacterium saliperosum]